MAHKALDLTFTDSPAFLTVWPNPARSTIQVQFDLPTDAASASLVIRDLAGRVVLTEPLGSHSMGQHTRMFNLAKLDSGSFEVSLEVGGSAIFSNSLIVIN
jgi:hypothetical protein